VLIRVTVYLRFLLPRLHLDRQGNQISIGRVRRALDDLPSKLDDTFEDAMSRTQHQPEEHCELALLALSWISRAQGPLQIEELQHAVTVQPGDQDIEDGELAEPALIVSVCAGLVTIHAESRNFRLVHFTVEEFFRKKYHEWFPDADKVIAETCLTYLSFDAFGPGICKNEIDLRARMRQYALLRYPAKNFGTHVDQASLMLDDVRNGALNFHRDELEVAAAAQAFQQMEHGMTHLSLNDDDERVPGIHPVVRAQCRQFIASWQACGEDINAQAFGRTVLVDAIGRRDLRMTSCLLDSGADVNDTNDDGRLALMCAARDGSSEGAELLLERGADPNAKGKVQLTSLHDAGIFGSEQEGIDTTDVLLKSGADLEARDSGGNTPLMRALALGRLHVVRHLLQRGSAVDVKNNHGKTALMRACSNEDLVKLLLQYGANVYATGIRRFTALEWAALVGASGVVEILVQSGANVNAVSFNGRKQC
jgi:Ankyrin repeats (3 copies)